MGSRLPWAWIVGLVTFLCWIASEAVVRPKERPGRVVVTYWEKWTKIEADAMRAVVDRFNASQDRIWVDYMSMAAVNTKTLMATAAGIPPDLAGVFDSDVVPFADHNALLILDDYCREAGIGPERYVPAYWDFVEYRGHVYGLPATPASTALHYNTRQFREVGLDPQRPPRTIEELSAFADRLVKRRADGKIVRMGFLPAEPGWWNWGWGYVFGGRLWDGVSRITANSPENVRAFEWVQSFSKKYGATPVFDFRSGFGTFSSPQNAFMAEKLSMVLQGVWMANHIQTHNPKLEWAAAPFPFPKDRPDLADSTFVALDVLVIPRGSKHPREAFEFVKFVQSQEGMELLCRGQQKHSPLANVSREFLSTHPNPCIRLFNDLPKGRNAFRSPKLGIWYEYQQELVSAFDDVYLLKKSPQEALDLVQARMQPKLDRYLETLRRREQTGALPPRGAFSSGATR